MRTIITIFLLLVGTQCLFAIERIDSLEQSLKTASKDEKKLDILISLVHEHNHIFSSKSLTYGKKALTLARELNNKPLLLEVYLELSTSYKIFDNFKMSYNYAQKAIKIAEKRKNKEKLVDGYIQLAGIYHIWGDYEKAIELFWKAISISEQKGYQSGKASAFGGLSVVYSSLGNFDKGTKYAFKAYKKWEEIGDKEKIAYSLRILALFDMYAGKQEDGKEKLVRAMNIFKSINSKEGIAEIYVTYANFAYFNKDYEASIRYLAKPFEIYSKYNSKEIFARFYNSYARLYKQLGKTDKASEYYLKELNTLEETKTEDNIGLYYIVVCNLYRSFGNYKKAEENLNLAAEAFDKKKDEYWKRSYFENYAELYDEWGKYDLAIKYNKLSIAESQRIGNKPSEAYFWKQIAAVYDKNGQLNEALESYKKALLIYHQGGMISNETDVKGQLGDIYYKLGDYSEAIRLQNEAMLTNEILAGNLEINNYLSLGKIYHKLKNFTSALQYFDKSIKLALGFGKPNILKSAYLHLSEIYFEKGNYKQAYYYNKLYSNLKDSLASKEQTTKTAEMQLNFEIDKQEKQKEILMKDNQIKILDLNRQKLIIAALVVIAVLILIIAIMTYRGLVLKNLINRQLTDANARLTESENCLIELNEAKDKYLNIINSDIDKASKYVTSLLPQPLLNGKLQTDWYFVPSEQIGGDSFGYHWLDDKHFAMYLIDVSGHGVGSALHSVSVLNVLRFQTLQDTDFREPQQVLKGLNEAFQMKQHNNLFLTIWYGIYNIETKTIKYSTGGHPPAIMCCKNCDSGKHTFKQLRVPNYVIGGKKGMEFEDAEVEVETPSCLYIFSDGVYEIIEPDGNVWGIDNFNSYMANFRFDDLLHLEISKLYNEVKKRRNDEKLDDDFSVLKVLFL